jgi:hypothetical protein
LPVDMALHKYMSNLPDYTVEIYASCWMWLYLIMLFFKVAYQVEKKELNT